MESTNVNRVIEEFSHLPLDEKEYVAEIIEKQITEAKREAIAQRAQEAMGNLEAGGVMEGSPRELREDLESD